MAKVFPVVDLVWIFSHHHFYSSSCTLVYMRAYTTGTAFSFPYKLLPPGSTDTCRSSSEILSKTGWLAESLRSSLKAASLPPLMAFSMAVLLTGPAFRSRAALFQVNCLGEREGLICRIPLFCHFQGYKSKGKSKTKKGKL